MKSNPDAPQHHRSIHRRGALPETIREAREKRGKCESRKEMKMENQLVMPLQPIESGRFVPNRIVEMLLEIAPTDLNKIACMGFTNQERMQFAQLIGYSLSGFSELSYVDDETYGAAERMAGGEHELQARNDELREQLGQIRKGLKAAASAAFQIHPDDLKA